MRYVQPSLEQGIWIPAAFWNHLGTLGPSWQRYWLHWLGVMPWSIPGSKGYAGMPYLCQWYQAKEKVITALGVAQVRDYHISPCTREKQRLCQVLETYIQEWTAQAGFKNNTGTWLILGDCGSSDRGERCQVGRTGQLPFCGLPGIAKVSKIGIWFAMST